MGVMMVLVKQHGQHHLCCFKWKVRQEKNVVGKVCNNGDRLLHRSWDGTGNHCITEKQGVLSTCRHRTSQKPSHKQQEGKPSYHSVLEVVLESLVVVLEPQLASWLV